MAAIAAHQVVVVAGETGSGKTTQLPKMCLDLGRGRVARIGHTQPRRIAARSVATRIAEELSTPLGSTVGYAVRFTDEVSDATAIKVMTDGILLAEIQRDRDLRQYDTLIIDEAHERSLTIDFILGYLKTLLPRRPDLKVVITSATIDPQRFAAHFGDAPVIEVSGRSFPVEVRYCPLVPDTDTDSDADIKTNSGSDTSTDTDAADGNDDGGGGAGRFRIDASVRATAPAPARAADAEPRDQIEGIVDALAELENEKPGDVLVFLSGEREIRDTADVLRALQLPNTEVLPLYARLPTAEQQRIFAAHPGRRIVLSTNIAETSLTVPGIRYVIDTGLARIVRYSARTKVQRLPIEAISQASAQQRAGRCGRVADGVCIRLYSERDFDARPEFTDPEILRTSLASVILQMATLGLGDVADFGFLDAPDRRAVRDGQALLHELGAFVPGEPNPSRAVTEIGRRMARLPVDPRLARMLIAADELGCLSEITVIAAALSIQDPRERPPEHEQAAAAMHARFRDEHSDFTAYLNLSRYLVERQGELSGNQFRRMCREEFLHYLRIREWQDLVSQLHRIARTLKLAQNKEPAGPDTVHSALLTGLLSQVGVRETDKREFQGARNTRFVLGSGSALAGKPPRWVMAAELVETSRLYARTAARTDPETIERTAAHLVQRSYSEPRWDARRGAAVANERVTLYGLTLVAGRTVPYGRIDGAVARELFIRHALVAGEWRSTHHFTVENTQLLADIARAEERLRRRDLLVDDETLVAFYDERLPADITSTRHFDSWWKHERLRRPALLNLTREVLTSVPDVAAEYPDEWEQDGVRLPLTYRFDPGALDDGITVHVPLSVVNQVDADAILAPSGRRRTELITELLRTLPKAVRRELGPAPNRAAELDTALDTAPDAAPAEKRRTADEPLLRALEREIRAATGVLVSRTDWQLDRLPVHLRPLFVLEDAQGNAVASGRDLRLLRAQAAAPLQAELSRSLASIERAGLTEWNVGDVPRSIEQVRGGVTVVGYPALVDERTSVALRVLPDERSQLASMRAGTARLLRLALPSPGKAVASALSPRERLALSANPDGSLADLVDDCLNAVVLAALDGVDLPWTQAAFDALVKSVRPGLAAQLARAVRSVQPVLAAGHDVDVALDALSAAQVPEALADLGAQRSALLPAGFVVTTGLDRMPDLARYLQAMLARMQRLPRERDVDLVRIQRIHEVQQAYRRVRDTFHADGTVPLEHPDPGELRKVAQMIEELRVSLFAQQLRTAYPVSEQRIFRALEAVHV